MIASEEQEKHIDELLNAEKIYHNMLRPYDFETDIEGDCDSVYIDGELSFDTMAKIVDYLRGK